MSEIEKLVLLGKIAAQVKETVITVYVDGVFLNKSAFNKYFGEDRDVQCEWWGGENRDTHVTKYVVKEGVRIYTYFTQGEVGYVAPPEVTDEELAKLKAEVG